MKVKFGDLLYIKGRIGWQALKKDEYLSNGDYLLITGVDIKENHRVDFNECYYVSKERYLTDKNIQLKNGDIIVTKDGTIGKVAYLEELPKPATLNSHLFLLRSLDPSKLNPKYLYYFLQSGLFQKYAINNTSGSNVPAFTQKSISEYEIDLPSLNEQIKITEILDLIEEQLLSKERSIDLYKSLAKSIYEYWFLDFNFPNEEKKPYKASGGKMVWNEELKQKVPQGWEISNLENLIISEIKGDWGKDSPNSKEKLAVNCVRGTDYSFLDGSSFNNNIPRRYVKNDESLLRPGDLIIEISGGSPTQSTGRIAYINQALLERFEVPLNTSNFCKGLRIKSEYVNWFYHTWNLLYQNNVFFNFESKTTGIKNLMLDTVLNSIKFPIPDSKNLEEFNTLIDPIYNEIQIMLKEMSQLKELRSFLLPLLMNGLITFKDIED